MTYLSKLKVRHDRLAEANEASYKALLAKAPGLTINTTDARLQCLIDALSKSLFTEQQRLEFELAFHEKVKESLDKVWADIQRQEKGRRLLKPGGLITPPGKQNG